jgi:hypothetical protein
VSWNHVAAISTQVAGHTWAPVVNIDWSDPAVRLLRFFGAVIAAAAGVAALRTDKAFEPRARPLSGFWATFPFANEKLTPWGATLLAIILIAPTVQFLGDWKKDVDDERSLRQTADNISKTIGNTVETRTTDLQLRVEGTLKSQSAETIMRLNRAIEENVGESSRAIRRTMNSEAQTEIQKTDTVADRAAVLLGATTRVLDNTTAALFPISSVKGDGIISFSPHDSALSSNLRFRIARSLKTKHIFLGGSDVTQDDADTLDSATLSHQRIDVEFYDLPRSRGYNFPSVTLSLLLDPNTFLCTSSSECTLQTKQLSEAQVSSNKAVSVLDLLGREAVMKVDAGINRQLTPIYMRAVFAEGTQLYAFCSERMHRAETFEDGDALTSALPRDLTTLLNYLRPSLDGSGHRCLAHS